MRRGPGAPGGDEGVHDKGQSTARPHYAVKALIICMEGSENFEYRATVHEVHGMHCDLGWCTNRRGGQ